MRRFVRKKSSDRKWKKLFSNTEMFWFFLKYHLYLVVTGKKDKNLSEEKRFFEQYLETIERIKVLLYTVIFEKLIRISLCSRILNLNLYITRTAQISAVEIFNVLPLIEFWIKLFYFSFNTQYIHRILSSLLIFDKRKFKTLKKNFYLSFLLFFYFKIYSRRTSAI
jgi:hypothetical protein